MLTGMFHPKILSTMREYSVEQFGRDLIAGLVVGIIALPLALAFGIASGVSPERGIITAVVAGFIISALGGSRVQIGGPTGAFIVIVYGVVEKYGMTGLTIATIAAGVLLVIMGVARLGSLIKFVPAPLVVGFTSGIALVIFTAQLKDVLGLDVTRVPADFLEKLAVYWNHLHTVNPWAVGTAAATVLIIVVSGRISKHIPGAFAALVLVTLAVQLFDVPVETIGSRFGVVGGPMPEASMPVMRLSDMRELASSIIAIAVLAGVESLLSAVVADGMIGGRHRSNTELIAQGIANIGSGLFGGIPATGAIARTAANVRTGGRTPVAGIIHAVTLLLILLFAGRLAAWIPLAALGGILVVVCYTMSEWREFRALLAAPKSDVTVLVLTFVVTVVFDLSLAIEVGMVLSAFLFMHRMAQASDMRRMERTVDNEEDADTYYGRPGSLSHQRIPADVDILEVQGAFFFGASAKFEQVIRESWHKSAIVLRMNNVYVLDATGASLLSKLARDARRHGVRLMIAELNEGCQSVLEKARAWELLGPENIFPTLGAAIDALSQNVAPLHPHVSSHGTSIRTDADRASASGKP